VYTRHSSPMVGVLLFRPSGVWPITSHKKPHLTRHVFGNPNQLTALMSFPVD